MRLTSFTDFGLRALMRLASDPDRAFSTAELATEFALSRNHLTKIIAKLAQESIVHTQRGSGGGAKLARSPGEIRLGDVVRILEADQPLVDCFSSSGGDCTIKSCCRLKTRLQAAEKTFLTELDRSTLADVALPVPAALTASGHPTTSGRNSLRSL